MKKYWSALFLLFGALLKSGNLILGGYFLYQAHKGFQDPKYTYALFGTMFLLFWLHDESNERKIKLNETIQSFKDEVRGSLIDIKRHLPKE